MIHRRCPESLVSVVFALMVLSGPIGGASLLAAPARAPDTNPSEQHRKALLDGVEKIVAPGIPGPLCVFGDRAFVVVVGGAGRTVREPVVAAAIMGKGRVVAFGHDGYFGGGALAGGDTGRLMRNAVRWAAGEAGAKAPGPRIAVRGQRGLLTFLRKSKLTVGAADAADWRSKLGSFDVLCTHPNSIAAPADTEAVAKFVREGGGLIVADTGWGWLQLHPGKTLVADHPGNRLLVAAGIVWTDGMLKRTADIGYAAGAAPPGLCHAARALDALVAHSAGKAKLSAADAAQASHVVSHAARSLPPGDTLLLPKLRRLQQDAGTAAVPTRKRPLTTKNPLGRLVLTLQLQQMRSLPPEKVRAHPAAGAFPGAVPADAKRVTRTVEIDTRVPAWHSTGLYAPPGEAITVAVPKAAAGKKLTVRIGAHNDRLWHHSAWRRCPEVCRRQAIGKPVTRAANAFGGLVYIEVPGGCKLGTVPAKIGGAVEAPFFVLGKTDPKQWQEKIRSRPAPWGELATGNVVLTLPSGTLRKVDDPEGVMKFWDQVMDACAELAARPLKRPRPERYVTDVQISAGYMHSGYPIMTFLDMPAVMIDVPRMKRNGHGGVWGLWHEMGHNHQSGDWTFGGAGEVTCNLFTLYVFEKACGMPPSAFKHLCGAARAKKIKAYLATGPDFEKRWKRDPFLALLMYMQLQEAFGWDAFKKVFKEYRDLPRRRRPRSDNDKRNQWLVRFSRTVGRNLGPFFQAWGVPTSDKARASVAKLPAWMPKGFPPK